MITRNPMQLKAFIKKKAAEKNMANVKSKCEKNPKNLMGPKNGR